MIYVLKRMIAGAVLVGLFILGLLAAQYVLNLPNVKTYIALALLLFMGSAFGLGLCYVVGGIIFPRQYPEDRVEPEQDMFVK
jgi:hypothetical protein